MLFLPHLRAVSARPSAAIGLDEVGGARPSRHLEQARPPLSLAVGLASESAASLPASLPRLFFVFERRF